MLGRKRKEEEVDDDDDDAAIAGGGCKSPLCIESDSAKWESECCCELDDKDARNSLDSRPRPMVLEFLVTAAFFFRSGFSKDFDNTRLLGRGGGGGGEADGS